MKFSSHSFSSPLFSLSLSLTLLPLFPLSMDTPNEWQLRRWACSFSDLLNDVTGRYHFEKFCKKQFCSENIKFWQTGRDLRSIPLSAVEGSVKLIYE